MTATIELRTAAPADIPELGRILYQAFYDIATSHGFPPDFPNPEVATGVMGLLLQQEDIYNVAAHDSGKLLGSNHLGMFDGVAAVGPVSVEPSAQGRGVGRQMMLDVMARAREQGFEMVRLVQDTYNMQSLALYASLGFEAREPTAYLALSQAGPPDADVRVATPDDFDAMGDLSREIYRVDRRNEIAALAAAGFPAIVLDRGHIAGYLLGTSIGHGVAESDDDMLALMRSLGAMAPGMHAFVPLRANPPLYRRALEAGHRNAKLCTLMTVGPYEPPQGTYAPSIGF